MPETTRINFTKAALEQLPMPELGRRAVFHDARCPGLSIRVTHTGAKSYGVQKRIAGRVERITIGKFPDMTIEQARNAARKVLGAVATGDNPAEVKRGKRRELTLQDLFDEYMTRRAAFNKRPDKPRDTFRLYLSPWANRKISTIKHEEVDRLHKKIGRERGQVTANIVLKLLHVMFNQAATVWRIYQGDNPAHGIAKFPEQSRDRFLQADELPRFFAALAADENPTMRDFFLVCLLTGARKTNVLEMRWGDISLVRAEWRIPETKSGQPQTVALAPEVIEILHARAAARPLTDDGQPCPWVFPGDGKSGHLAEPKTAWRRILQRAELADVHIHDLRRTLGSWQARTGASLVVIGKSLGHKSQQATAVYSRLDMDPIRVSVEGAVSAMVEAGGFIRPPVMPLTPREE